MTEQQVRMKPGSRYRNEDAVVIEEELNRLLKRDGAIVPEAVVEEAHEEASPLHRFFEWDKERAAHSYLLTQARYMLRSIEIKVERVSTGEVQWTRKLHVVEGQGQQRYYVAAAEVAHHEDYLTQIQDRALRQLNLWTQQYAQYMHYPAFFPIKQRIEQIYAELAAAD